MWWLLLWVAQTPQEQAARVRAQMQVSVATQRAAVEKQAQAARAAAPRPAAPRPAQWTASAAAGGSSAGGSWSSSRSLMRREPPPCEPVPGPELASLVNWAAREQNLDPLLVREVARQESGFRPCARSSQGAMGVMQLMPETQVELGVSDPWDARQSIDAGSRLLRQLLDRYHGDLTLALSAYNAGAGTVDLAGGIPAIPETRDYVGSILYRLSSLGKGLPGSAMRGLGGADGLLPAALSPMITLPPTEVWDGITEGIGGGP